MLLTIEIQKEFSNIKTKMTVSVAAMNRRRIYGFDLEVYTASLKR